MMHIIERFLLHFVASTFLTLAFFFALRFWVRRSNWLVEWIAPHKSRLLVVSALCVFSVATLREPFDVAAGQWWVKAITDQISWFLGPAVSVWGLSRFDKLEE